MVTLTLIQGVVNTFVIFLSRVVGYVVDRASSRTERGQRPGHRLHGHQRSICRDRVRHPGQSIIVAWFSRQREFRADAGAASLMGSPLPMQNALRRLGNLHTEPLPQNMAASGIAGGKGGFMALLATHPPLEERIAALSRK
ncbi:MAG: M48 family metalloprotease [Comamonadaceae bacterium]|nr:M48 family metalloprotease [Comamonadaceae bacterium]